MKKRILIWDIDNTLYDFVDYFGPAFRSMVARICSSQRIAEADFLVSAQNVYREMGTLEHKHLVQNMSLFSSRSPDEKRAIAISARNAFNKVKKTHLELYPGIINVLKAARYSGIRSICVTNAPYYQVGRRLSRLRVTKLIDGLIAWEGSAADTGDVNYQKKYERMTGLFRARYHIFTTLPSTMTKPSSEAYRQIIKTYGSDFEYFVIGDSIAKDLAPGRLLGMRTIWAKYGTRFDPKNLKTLIDVTPWNDAQIDHSFKESITPDYIAKHPEDLFEILSLEAAPAPPTQRSFLHIFDE